MSETNPSTPPNEAADVCVLNSRGMRENRKAADIKNHDFRQSGFLAPSELRRIRQRHDQFIRSLAARLAIFLRLEFSLQLSKIVITGYQKFTESIPTPTHIALFKTEPLKGVGLLVVPPKLGLAIVDRMLGGPGVAPEQPRDLTEIEIALIAQVTGLVIGEWCNHWPEMRGLNASLLGHENNSHYLQTSTPDTAMMVLTLTGGIGDQAEPLQMVFPYATVEPLMRLLSPAMPDSEGAPAQAAKPKWNTEFNEVKVPVVAEWQGLKMSAGDITRLKVGDLLALDPACAAQVHILLNQIPKFTGRPGTSLGKWAVQLTGNISNPNSK